MFITIQFPFVDLRRFLQYPPEFVPGRSFKTPPEITDLEKIAKDEYVRCFGHYRLRSYVPKIKVKKKIYSGSDKEWQDLNLNGIWHDEYLYASTRRALRFGFLEKQQLLGGKLCKPKAKIRALRFSSVDPASPSWSPCIRIETGIMYDVPKALNGIELIKALDEFMKQLVKVPVYEKEGAGSDAIVKQQLEEGPLLAQQKKLAQLIVNGTTAQHVLRVHHNMILPGEPLLTVHYTNDEISELPPNTVSLPSTSDKDVKISYHPLRQPGIGLWLFELPYSWDKMKTVVKKRETIRNNTIAIMRYWSEFQATIALRNAVTSDSFEFSKANSPMQNYVNNATKFLLSGTWHGAQLDIIRNIINAHQSAAPDRQPLINQTIKNFKKQVAEKLLKIGTGNLSIFVSYSHFDKDYLPGIQTAFGNLIKTNQIAYFDDNYIGPGSEWEQKIITALENTSVAVMLISPSFFKSAYISSIENPKIADRFKRGKLNIIPVLIDGELPKKGFFSRIQFLNANSPLSASSTEKKTEIMKLLVEKILAFQTAGE